MNRQPAQSAQSAICTCGAYWTKQRPRRLPSAINQTLRQYREWLDRFFHRQYREAIDRRVYETGETDWLTSKERVQVLFEQTNRSLGLMVEERGTQAARRVGIMMTDFIERPRVIASVRARSLLVAESVSQTSADRLRDAIAEGLNEGESIKEIMDRIRGVFGFDTESDLLVDMGTGEIIASHRAEMIARTETANALTLGDRLAWKESGVVESVRWLAPSDACPFCLAMDGQMVDVATDESFWSKGDTMAIVWDGKRMEMSFDLSDIMGPPLHPNCRCSTQAVLIPLQGGGGAS